MMRWAPAEVSGTHSNCESPKYDGLSARQRLSLGELEASASALLAVLLALLTTRVAGNEAFCLERLAELGVELHQCAGDAELDGIGLSHDAATLDGGDDIEGLADVGDTEGALCGCALLRGDEVDV